jgi:hypothetical protein
MFINNLNILKYYDFFLINLKLLFKNFLIIFSFYYINMGCYFYWQISDGNHSFIHFSSKTDNLIPFRLLN